MADVRKIIKVFLASPGDLQEERRTAKAVVDEFNKLWADVLGYHVELVGWEDTVSGFGRPQALINRDLEQCEVFVGMLWKRWGTPPDLNGPYTSGFEEEYEISVRGKRETGRPEISLLFKTVDAEQLRDPGPELAKVVAFKEKLVSEKMILFDNFNTLPQFQDKLRSIVTTYVQRLYTAEAAKAQEDTKSLPLESEGGAQPSPPSSPAETRFSEEGASFLQGFIAKAVVDSADIENVEVARFRLLASLLSKHGNDESTLGVHDANLLYANRDKLNLGIRERVGLVRCGLEHFTSSNVPLWYWYVTSRSFEHETLPFYTLYEPNDRRVGALRAMRLTGQLLAIDNVIPRSRFVIDWLAEGTADVVKVAALAYLGDWGTREDLPSIKAELDRARYQTSGAAIDATIRINLRDSREDAIRALFDLQPDSINQQLTDLVFDKGASIQTELLVTGLDHRGAAVRRICATLLRERGELSREAAERLVSDTNADVRFEALQALIAHGKTFTLAEARSALVKPALQGLLTAGSSDRAGEVLFSEWQRRQYMSMSVQELDGLAANASIFDQDAYFALLEHDFDHRKTELRAAIDDLFVSHFNAALEKMGSQIGTTSDTYKKTMELGEYLRQKYTRQALSILSRRSDPADLGRVRQTLRVGFVTHSDIDVEYLRKHGEWQDIPLIVSSVDRTDYSLGLWSLDDAKYDAAAKAIYTMGRGRFAELVGLPMPNRLLKNLILVASDKSIRALSAEDVIRLFGVDDDYVRKITALRCIRGLPKSRLKGLMTVYLSGDTYRYYNVVHWLDLGIALPKPLAVETAGRALVQD